MAGVHLHGAVAGSARRGVAGARLAAMSDCTGRAACPARGPSRRRVDGTGAEEDALGSRRSRPMAASRGWPTAAVGGRRGAARVGAAPGEAAHRAAEGCGSHRWTSRCSPSARSSSTSVAAAGCGRTARAAAAGRRRASRAARRPPGVPDPGWGRRRADQRGATAAAARQVVGERPPARRSPRPLASRQQGGSVHGVRREQAGQPPGDGVAPALPELCLLAGVAVAEVLGRAARPRLVRGRVDHLSSGHTSTSGSHGSCRGCRELGDQRSRASGSRRRRRHRRPAGARGRAGARAAGRASARRRAPGRSPAPGEGSGSGSTAVRQPLGEQVGALCPVHLERHAVTLVAGPDTPAADARLLLVLPEISTPVDLCTVRGRLNRAAVGWTRRPLHRPNLRGWGRTKRWEYWGLVTDSPRRRADRLVAGLRRGRGGLPARPGDRA